METGTIAVKQCHCLTTAALTRPIYLHWMIWFKVEPKEGPQYLTTRMTSFHIRLVVAFFYQNFKIRERNPRRIRYVSAMGCSSVWLRYGSPKFQPIARESIFSLQEAYTDHGTRRDTGRPCRQMIRPYGWNACQGNKWLRGYFYNVEPLPQLKSSRLSGQVKDTGIAKSSE